MVCWPRDKEQRSLENKDGQDSEGGTWPWLLAEDTWTFTPTKSRAIILASLSGGDPTDYCFTAPHINIKQVEAWENVCVRPHHLHSEKRRYCVAALEFCWRAESFKQNSRRWCHHTGIIQDTPCSRVHPNMLCGLVHDANQVKAGSRLQAHSKTGCASVGPA